MEKVCRWVVGIVAMAVAVHTAGPLSGQQLSSRDLAASSLTDARLQEQLGNLHEAQAQYEEIVALDDEYNEFADLRAEAGVRLAIVLMKLGRKDRAIQTLENVLRIKEAPPYVKEWVQELLDRHR